MTLESQKRCLTISCSQPAYRQELDEKFGVTYQRHLRDLQSIRALNNGAYSAAVQAEYRRGQAHGDIYVSTSEIRTGTIDSMNKDEVMKALIKRNKGILCANHYRRYSRKIEKYLESQQS